MVIYGTALLSICLLLGMITGKLLGLLIGVDANVGGVGIAMLLLIVASDRLQQLGLLPQPSRNGVLFWSAIYVPIVVAMAASQNVLAALSGGPVALVAGTLAVVLGFCLVPVLTRLSQSGDEES
ncbi:MAG: malonate transporter subunit MadL [Bythopirellula sp.]